MREKRRVSNEVNGRTWYLCFVLILLLGIGIGNQARAAGSATFTVGATSYYMDGVAQNMDVAPYINNGRTYVPILYLAQAVGVQTNNVVWDAGNATITLSKGAQVIQMQVGSKTLLVKTAPHTQWTQLRK
ncbi:MAG: copper amine oxidase N-terminal domain-containing protein [Syntrophomonas sp.]